MPSFRSVYGALLFLYPKPYRKKYGNQILQTVEDMLEDEPQTLRRLRIQLREIVVLPGNAFEQHLAIVARKENLTPSILMGIIALSLLLPFFVAMASDEISEHFYNQHLYGSWFWSKPVLTVWVIALPLLSLFTSLTTGAILILRASLKKRKLTLPLKKLWLISLAALTSSGVVFLVVIHDSSQCWTGNATKLSDAVHCTENIFLSSDKK